MTYPKALNHTELKAILSRALNSPNERNYHNGLIVKELKLRKKSIKKLTKSGLSRQYRLLNHQNQNFFS